jgi:hypothetical protein
VAAEIRDKTLPLHAEAIGRIARTFGLDRTDVHLEHIKDFVSELVNGWTLQCSQLGDLHTMSSYATTFAMTLQSQRHRLQDVMGAFIDGCQEGTRIIEFYARRRKGVYRRRKTD